MRWIKPFVFLLCLLPLLRLFILGLYDALGPDPVAFLIHSTGIWSLVLLMVTLTVTPLRRLLRIAQLLTLRRMFGQYAFFYGIVHFLLYAYFDQYLKWEAIWHDVISRPFITTGFISLVLLVPLSLTSTNSWVKRLGPNRWRKLHRLVYPSAILAVLHFWLEVKRDLSQPLIYATLLGILLTYRIAYWLYVRCRPFVHR